MNIARRKFFKSIIVFILSILIFGNFSIAYSSQDAYATTKDKQQTMDFELWTPAEIGDALVLWLDADEESTIELNDGKVSQWMDKSGNNNHATQTQDNRRPVYETDALNGKPSLIFDGQDDFMSLGNGLSFQDGFTVYAVARVRDHATARRIITKWGGQSPKGGDWMLTPTKDIPHRAYLVANNIPSYISEVSGTPDNDNYHLYGMVHTLGSSLVAYYDGRAGENVTVTTRPNISTTEVRIGASTDGYFSPISVSEIVIVSKSMSVEERQKLEGYFAHKWGLTDRLPVDHPYRNQMPGDIPPEEPEEPEEPEIAAWTPLEASENLALWLDASDESTIEIGNGRVSQWKDKSGNNIHATQTQENRRPVYETDALNGKPSLIFDGDNDFMSLGNGLSFQDGFTVYAVARVRDHATARRIITKWGGQSPKGGDWMLTPTKDIPHRAYLCSNTIPSYISAVSGTPDNANYHLYGMVHTLSSSLVAYYDGRAGENVTVTTRPNISTSEVRIGASTDGYFSPINVSEIVIVSKSMSVEERQKLEGYLAHKWGLGQNLPADHPYKNKIPEASKQFLINEIDIVDSKISVNITNNTPLNKATLIVASYDKENILQNLEIKEIELDVGQSTVINTDLIYKEGEKIKAFVWEDLTSQKPLSKVRNYPPPTPPGPVNPWKAITGNSSFDSWWVMSDDLNNDGVAEFVYARLNSESAIPRYVVSVTAVDVDGNVLWQWGDPSKGVHNRSSDVACQIYDWNGDGIKDVLICTNTELKVLRGTDGQEIRSLPLPAPTANDCIAIVNLSGNERATDIIVKDRYQNAWAFDYDWNLLWHEKGSETPSKTLGHFPFARDIDGDGRDEVMIGFRMLNHDGTERWRADWVTSGHADSIRVLKDGGSNLADWRIAFTYCTGGGICVVDGYGNKLYERRGLHYQSIRVGDIDKSSPGNEMVVDTQDGRLFIFRSDLTILKELPGGVVRNAALIDWDGNGEMDVVVPTVGRIYDKNGDIIAQFDKTTRFVKVGDFDGDGKLDVVLDERNIYIYTCETDNSANGQIGTGVNWTAY